MLTTDDAVFAPATPHETRQWGNLEAEGLERVHSWVLLQRGVYRNLLPMSPERIEANWPMYVQLLHDILGGVQEHNSRTARRLEQLRAQHRQEPSEQLSQLLARVGKQFGRRFQLLPQSAWAQPYIHITTPQLKVCVVGYCTSALGEWDVLAITWGGSRVSCE